MTVVINAFTYILAKLFSSQGSSWMLNRQVDSKGLHGTFTWFLHLISAIFLRVSISFFDTRELTLARDLPASELITKSAL